MINKIKTYLILILLFLGVIFALQSFLLRDKVKRQAVEINAKNGVILGLNKEKNKYIEIAVYNKDIKSLKNSNDSIEKKMYRIIEDNELKARKIKELQMSQMQITDTIETVIEWKHTDTLLFGTANYSDKWLNAEIVINEDKLNMTYNIECELYGVKHSVRDTSNFFLFRWFNISMKPKYDKFRFYSDNQNIQFTNIRIIEDEK